MRRMSRHRGFTLTELMLVLGVGGILIAGAFYSYKTASTDAKDAQIKTALLQLAGSVKNKWSTAGNYSGISAQKVIQAGLVSAPFKTSGSPLNTINHDYGGTVEFAPTGTDANGKIADNSGTSYMRIQITNVPTKLCSEIVAAFDPMATAIKVGDTAVKDMTENPNPMPLNFNTTLDKCNEAQAVTVKVYIM